jgi:hypothetical protein
MVDNQNGVAIALGGSVGLRCQPDAGLGVKVRSWFIRLERETCPTLAGRSGRHSPHA